MPSKKYRSLFRLPLLCLVVVVLLLGIFFRFANLEGKVFWVDEVATAVRVSGYSIPEVIEDLKAKDIVSREELLQYQRIDRKRNLNDVWQALIKSPEHAPLYFLLARFWLQLWGNSLVVMRSLSVWLSLLIFPSLYWLYRELFNKPLVPWLGIMLMSVSPFYVAYAQESRPYSLWTVTILCMGASFLRAIRINTKQGWALYIASLVFAFYTSLLSLFIAGFQGIYLLLANFKNKKQLINNYFISNAIALLFFSPWLIVLFTSLQTLQDNTVWMRTSIDVTALIATWIGTILLIFGDLPLSPEADAVQTAIAVIIVLIGGVAIFYFWSSWHRFSYKISKIIRYSAIGLIAIFVTTIIFQGKSLANYIHLDLVTAIGAIVAVGILSLASYSFYFSIKNCQRTQWLFIICLILSLPIPLLIADLISQGQSSAAPRYLIPFQLGIQLAVAYTLSTKLDKVAGKTFKQQQVWAMITIFFLTLGVFSCTRNLNLSPIYLKTRNIDNPAIANIINQKRSPLILIEPQEAVDILSLSHSVLSHVKFKIIDGDLDLISYGDNFSDVFVLKPSLKLQNNLSNNRQINFQQVYQPNLLVPGQISLELWSVIRDR